MHKKVNQEYILKTFEINNISMVMKSKEEIVDYIIPDDDYDFHSYRILLLISKCGVSKENLSDYPLIYGRNKFAFYDFLIRNPFYLEKVIYKLSGKSKVQQLVDRLALRPFEKNISFSAMIKYLRGPWDPKYDNILSYLVSKQLITVKYEYLSEASTIREFILELTTLGNEISESIIKEQPLWVARMDILNSLFPPNTTEKYIEKTIKEFFPELVL
jgi:hypothetical protein